MIRFLIQLQRVINYRNVFLVCVSLMAIFTLSAEITKARASHDWLHFSALTLVLVTMWLQARRFIVSSFISPSPPGLV